jgi:Holliday junction DNA helicase RuvB
VATAAAWQHLGLTPPPDLAVGGISVRSSEVQQGLFE